RFHIDTGDAPPIKSTFYRTSPDKQRLIDKEVAKLLSHGLIRKSRSPWASPVSVAKKKDSPEGRFVMDYRKLNTVTKKDAYPLPLIEDCLETCKDAKYMTIIDLADAYHHVPMRDDASIERT